MISNDVLAEWDRDNFMHPSTLHGAFARGEQIPKVMTGGEGVYVTDRDGNRMLDAFAGLYCVNVGYGRMEIVDAIAEQARQLAYFSRLRRTWNRGIHHTCENDPRSGAGTHVEGLFRDGRFRRQ